VKEDFVRVDVNHKLVKNFSKFADGLGINYRHGSTATGLYRWEESFEVSRIDFNLMLISCPANMTFIEELMPHRFIYRGV